MPMKEIKQTRIIYLVSGYLEKRLTPEESRELVAWKQAKPSNAKLFEELTDLSYRTEAIAEWNASETESSLIKLQAKRDNLPVKRKLWWPYAAAMSMLLVFGIYFYRSQDAAQNVQPSLVNDALPGSNKATLRLSDGSVIQLDATHNGTIAQLSGIKSEAGEEMKQTFYVGKDNTFTFKEAYNLMDGRAVNKDLVNKQEDKYNSWVQLDRNDADEKGNFKVKHFHENYGYDLEAVLSKHKIKELGDDTDKGRLIDSLKKGNKQSVTFIKEGEEQKGFVQANPQYKSLKIFDGKGKEIRQNETRSEKQDTKKSAKQTEKPNDEDNPSAGQNKKQTRKRGIKA